MMKKYKLSRIVEGYVPIEVEAESMDEAMKIARELPVDNRDMVQTGTYIQFEGYGD